MSNFDSTVLLSLTHCEPYGRTVHKQQTQVHTHSSLCLLYTLEKAAAAAAAPS